MNKKETFFELVSEYLVSNLNTHKVYQFDYDDFDKITWFLEMVWSISEDFDVRICRETPHSDLVSIYIRTAEPYWKLKKD